MAAIYDFNVVQGDQFDARLTVKDANGTMDLEGYAARGYIKNKYSDTGILIDMSPTVVSGDASCSMCPSGYIDIKMLASETKSLPVTQGIFDIEIYKDSYVKKVAVGNVNISPEITN
tara:strand:+ start:44512 stop:44862 length:351 start_codon:yes stop_codon:yes gene_type:complete